MTWARADKEQLLPLKDVAPGHTLPAPAHILAGDAVLGLGAPAALGGAQRVADVTISL